MIHPLIERLTGALGYPLLDAASLDAHVQAEHLSVLLFVGDLKRYPEGLDVAVVLPELLKVFPQLSPAVIASADETTLQARYGFTIWPTLVFLKQGRYLGSLSRVLNWSDYLQRIPELLASEPQDILGRIPVLSLDGSSASCSHTEAREA